MPRARRVSSRAPISSSRSRICRLKEGCDVCSFIFAATVRLSASATAMKYRRWEFHIASHASKAWLASLQSLHPSGQRCIRFPGRQAIRSIWQDRRNAMSKKLEGKVALVTGGSRGIGAAIAKRLAADGASVAITYTKDENAASSVVKAIERGGGKGLAIRADAADPDAGKAAVEKTVATFGRLDVLANYAGTAIATGFGEARLAKPERVLDIRVSGTL